MTLPFDNPTGLPPAPLPRPDPLSEEGGLVRHLMDVTGLEERVVAKVLDEIRSCYGRTLEEWIRDRHGELQREGMRNEEIFERLLNEAGRRRFAAPPLTARKIRRMIYG